MSNAANLRTWSDLSALYGDIRWLWPSWLPHGFVTMLAADPGTGKSLLALHTAHMVMHGNTWPDNEPNEPDPYALVLWIECESGEPFHIHRAQLIGMDIERIVEPFMSHEDSHTPRLTNAEDKQRIAATLALPEIALCVIDSFSGSMEGDENSAEAGKVTQWLAEQAKATNKPVLLIHHLRKRIGKSEDPPTQADIRGSSAITQHCRVIWTLDTPDAMSPDKLRLAQAKNNLAPRPKPLMLFIGENARIQTSTQRSAQAWENAHHIRDSFTF